MWTYGISQWKRFLITKKKLADTEIAMYQSAEKASDPLLFPNNNVFS
jgi:hypothetical protein